MSSEPITITEPRCAFCRHWMIGTLEMDQRFADSVKHCLYTCHVKQPMKTDGLDSCKNFEAAGLTL